MSNNVPADKVMYFSPKLHQNNYKNNQVELKTDAKECHYCSHGQGLASSVLAPSHDIHLHDHNVDPWPWCGLALIFIQQTFWSTTRARPIYTRRKCENKTSRELNSSLKRYCWTLWTGVIVKLDHVMMLYQTCVSWSIWYWWVDPTNKLIISSGWTFIFVKTNQIN